MQKQQAIYLVGPSLEENRPVIDFTSPSCRTVNWKVIDEILRGQRCVGEYQPIHIELDAPEAILWSYYSIAGTLGLFSDEAVSRIGHSAFRHYQLLPAQLNQKGFTLLKPIELLPCLDLAKSDVVAFRSNPNRIKEVRKYVFKKEMIDDNLLFSIPELPGLFATDPVRTAVLQNLLSGFAFHLVD